MIIVIDQDLVEKATLDDIVREFTPEEWLEIFNKWFSFYFIRADGDKKFYVHAMLDFSFDYFPALLLEKLFTQYIHEDYHNENGPEDLEQFKLFLLKTITKIENKIDEICK